MDQNGSNNGRGISVGFTGLLQLVFIVLKLCGVIDWAWGWVLAPAWISAALVVLIFVVAIILVCVEDRNETRKR